MVDTKRTKTGKHTTILAQHIMSKLDSDELIDSDLLKIGPCIELQIKEEA